MNSLETDRARTHSCWWPVPAELSPGLLQARLAAANLPLVQIWVDPVAGLVAARSRELTRPAPVGLMARAVVLVDPTGQAELVITAYRSQLDSTGLQQLGEILLTESSAVLTRPQFQWGTESAQLSWGIPEGVGIGTLDLALPQAISATQLVAGLQRVLASYGEASPVAQLGPNGLTLHPAAVPSDAGRSAVAVQSAAERSAETVVAQPESSQLTQIPAIGFIDHPADITGNYHPFASPPFGWTAVLQSQAQLKVAYRRSVLCDHQAQQFTCQLLRALAGESQLLEPAEQAALSGRYEGPVGEFASQSIPQKFAEIAAAQPTALAVSDDSRSLSYAEVQQAAQQLAQELILLGVQPGGTVGICVEREVGLVVACLAVMQAGAAYVPMDMRYPEQRLRLICADAGVHLVLAGPDFPEIAGVTRLDPNQLPEREYREPLPPRPKAPAYVIYTSGSTGEPKGVVVPQENVLALITATQTQFSLGPGDVWSLFHSAAFDFSVWEMWGCLLTGGHLQVVSYWVSRSPEEFYGFIRDRAVTVLSQTPSAFASFAEADSRLNQQLALRLVIFGGEALPVSILPQWFRRHPQNRCRLINMYGITETTVHVTAQEITPIQVAAKSRSVGQALPGWTISVRDPDGHPQPVGVPGEIYVGGVALAAGYLGRPELTQQRFIQDEITGQRMYRSGDLGRLQPNGCLDHLGRIDDQIKLRGFRIELGEVQAAILADPQVLSAKVLFHDGAGDSAQARLEGVVVLRSGDCGQLRSRLEQCIPEHLVPAVLTQVPELPLTAQGKIDERVLRAVVPVSPQPELPTSDVAEKVLAAWQKVLGAQAQLGDDFFELGGNSLLAVRLSAALRRAGLPAVPLRELYQRPRGVDLVEHLQAGALKQNLSGAVELELSSVGELR